MADHRREYYWPQPRQVDSKRWCHGDCRGFHAPGRRWDMGVGRARQRDGIYAAVADAELRGVLDPDFFRHDDIRLRRARAGAGYGRRNQKPRAFIATGHAGVGPYYCHDLYSWNGTLDGRGAGRGDQHHHRHSPGACCHRRSHRYAWPRDRRRAAGRDEFDRRPGCVVLRRLQNSLRDRHRPLFAGGTRQDPSEMGNATHCIDYARRRGDVSDDGGGNRIDDRRGLHHVARHDHHSLFYSIPLHVRGAARIAQKGRRKQCGR